MQNRIDPAVVEGKSEHDGTAIEREEKQAGGPHVRAIALYVDRSTRQWVVRDPQGEFWLLPAADESWERRLPFELTADADLESVPRHYRYMLRLPF